MRITLSIANAPYRPTPRRSIASALSRACQTVAESFPGDYYWGRYGARRRTQVLKFGDLAKDIGKFESKIYVFSSARAGVGQTELQLSFRPGLLSLQLSRELELPAWREETRALIEFVRGACTDLQRAIVFPLVSVISMAVDYAQPRPPQRWRAFDPRAIVDVISPSRVDFPDARRITQRLQSGPLPRGVTRHELGAGLVMVDWGTLAPAAGPLDIKLTRRCVWYYANSQFEPDSQYNAVGDLRVDRFADLPRRGLTFFDPMTSTGYKALSFAHRSGTVAPAALRQLQAMLRKTRSRPAALANLFVIASAREEAAQLEPAVRRHQLSGVVYSDDEGQLWNPFPPGRWLD